MKCSGGRILAVEEPFAVEDGNLKVGKWCESKNDVYRLYFTRLKWHDEVMLISFLSF